MKFLSSIIFLTILSFTLAQDRNPCHSGRNVNTIGAFNCEGIILPRQMCRQCDLTAYDNAGRFNNCKAIYNTGAPKCLAQLQEYVRLNPCDEIRANQMKNPTDPKNLEHLDYFVYSICEECCDCIPKGKASTDFESSKQSKTLISLVRGNCPAHAHFDICRVLPNIRHIVNENGKALDTSRQKVCPMFKTWIQGPGKNWGAQTNADINQDIKKFLRDFNRAARCRSKYIWEMCAKLEETQGRI